MFILIPVFWCSDMVAQYFIFGSTLYVIVFFFLIEVFQFNSIQVLYIGPLKSVLMWKKKKKVYVYRWPQICGRNFRLFFWVALVLSVFFSPSSLVVSETYNDNMLIWAALNQWIFIARLDHISLYHWNCWKLLAVKHDLSKENILKLFLLSWLVSPNDLNCKLLFLSLYCCQLTSIFGEKVSLSVVYFKK